MKTRTVHVYVVSTNDDNTAFAGFTKLDARQKLQEDIDVGGGGEDPDVAKLVLKMRLDD